MHRLPAISHVAALTLLVSASLSAQTISFPLAARADSVALDRAMAAVARNAARAYAGNNRDDSLNTTFRLQMLAGDRTAGLATLQRLRTSRMLQDPTFAPHEYTQYEVYARASTPAAVRREFLALDARQGDLVAYRVAGSFNFDLASSRVQWERALAAAPAELSLNEAVALCRQYFVYRVYRTLLPVMPAVLKEAESRRYAITEAASVPLRDGGTLTATVVRPRRLRGPQPAVLEYTIYAGSQNRINAIDAASQGFIGIVATPRGKRSSKGPVRPWETEAADARDLLEWISTQPWSNGAVGMTGGSYSGFTQWAAAGTLHPALKTIVPTVAVAPGVDFPRENGVVLNFQYSWAHYVGRDSLLDEAANRDGARWARLDSTWFARGSAYRERDVIDGVPNPLFRRWLDHPTFDAYWQAMMPSRDAYAKLAIPVLSITGYFDGAQPGALHYYRTHTASQPNANHTLLIGPWDHFGAQRRPSPVLGDLRIDPVANVDIGGLIYDWMRHVLRGAPRPALLADRVNFEVVGANRWEHVPSLSAASNDTIALHLSAQRDGVDHRLLPRGAPTNDAGMAAELTVDMRDRTVTSGTFISLGSDTTLDRSNGVAFVSDALTEATTFSGAFTTDLVASLNARDVDLGVVLYERTADGRYTQLSYYLGRASLARDATRRQLLIPGAQERLPLHNTRFVSRVLAAGSRLVVLVNVNKNDQSQLNYGTGKDPSDETITDATTPLRLTLFEGSVVRIPVLRRTR